MSLESIPVILLGMHRSGTSSLAGSLQQNGLYLGKVFEWNPHNPKGNRENEEIMHLNDTLFKSNGGSWYNPPHTISWNKELAERRDKIIQTFISSSEKIWGFKDPRSVFTLPFWKESLPNSKLVGIFRHPLLVAKSLHARTAEMPLQYGFELWERYNKRLLSYFEEHEFPLMSFDVSPKEYQSSIKNVVKYLGLQGKQENGDMLFFDVSLKKQNAVKSTEIVPAEIMQLYEKLNQIYKRQFLS